MEVIVSTQGGNDLSPIMDSESEEEEVTPIKDTPGILLGGGSPIDCQSVLDLNQRLEEEGFEEIEVPAVAAERILTLLKKVDSKCEESL